jgi:hypothetical protein
MIHVVVYREVTCRLPDPSRGELDGSSRLSANDDNPFAGD